ncbi:type II secretion system protein [Neobacillus kokaensis]|uniref:Prepilin-type N-terminal cleavage/methylation domain-containing protein n=1 Tax=Neobacillus kokaensis TaxID=2759023 RepID=A0ABQ3MY67_9BACI|nr:type II secretion system protein [Neobacillus kokaensis]GHH97194.1 hypothetical protein AM1BK_07370 [Neobacillus kokaensis]
MIQDNERGLTLIEVLATLTILSIVSVIIWSIFLQGYNFSQKAISKNFILQESNILITNLKKIHQTVVTYDIKSENCDVKVRNLTTSPTQEEIFDHAKICYKILEINNVNSSTSGTIEPNKKTGDLALKIRASDKNNSDNYIIIDTYLYRVKGVDYQ